MPTGTVASRTAEAMAGANYLRTEALAALGAARIDHAATTDGAHARTEAVGAGTL